MQHKRSRLTTKILAFVLILALVFPASAFASVADVAKDTRSPGKSLANTYPAYTDIEWQISLAENAQAMVTVPTNMTEEELGTALSGDLTLSLDRDSTRGYLNPEKFPYPYQGGALDTWMTQWTKDKQPQNLFRVTEMGISVDEAGKVSLKLWIDINCYFGNRSGNVDYSAPHSNGGAYLDLCGYYTLNVTAGDEAVGSIHTKIVPYDSFRSLVYKGRKVALHGGAYAPSYLPNDVDTFACGVNCGNHQIHHPPLIVKVHFFPCVQIAGNFFDLFRADGVHTQLRYLFDKLLLASVQFFNLAVHIGEQDGICPGQRVNERFNFMLDLCEFYLQGGQLWIGLHSIFSPLDGLERF